MSKQGQGILVVGMHRSGTSAVAGALERLGVSLGPELVPAAEDNPKGYFEHAPVVGIHEQLFRELGRWWYDPRPLPQGWLETPAARRAQEALCARLRADFQGQAVWAVKDPRTCRFLPLWDQALARLDMAASALLVVRDPSQVCASLAARNGFGAELAELLWLRHVVDAVRGTAGRQRTVLNYAQVVAAPGPAIEAALERLEVGLAMPQAQRAQALEGFVDAAFQHHAQVPPTDATAQAGLAHRMFAALDAISRGAGDWDALEPLLAEFDQHWQQVGPYLQAMGDAVFPDLEAKARLAEEIHAARSELTAQVRWGKETLAQHEALRESLTRERDQLAEALALARSDLTAQVRWAEGMLEQHRAALAEAHRLAAIDREHSEQQRQALDQLQASFSWRVTAPLRSLARLFGGPRATDAPPTPPPAEKDQ
ncbi:MAG TPA: hypothetical protein VFY00_04350 [Arenimonas sp.]|nr:hypothetical protein [Arenimonas sp.]